MQYLKHVIGYNSKTEWFNIIPLGDIHLGHAGCDFRYLKDMLKWIEEKSNTFWIGMGDYIDAINYSDPRFDPKTVMAKYLVQGDIDKIIQMQIEDIVDLFEPIKGKCLGLLRGNHEECYSEDTMVLTKNGWKKYNELKIGEEILTWRKPDGFGDGVLEYQPIKRIAIYDYNGEAIHIIGSKIDLVVTPSHRMVVKSSSSSYQVVPAYLVKANKKGWTNYVPISGEWNGLPCNLTDDEIKLIGWLISEGSIEYSQNKQPRISIHQSIFVNEKKVEEINQIIKNLDFNPHTYIHKNNVKSWRFNVEESKKILELMDGDIKHIPRVLLDGSKKQLMILLNTMIKGDGTVWKQNRQPKAYYTSDIKLVHQLEELILKIGWNPTITIRKGHLTEIRDKEYQTKDGYVVGFWRQTKYNGIQSKKIIWYKGKVWCPEVDNTFIVVKRNNKICISGNTIRKHYHYDVIYEIVKDLGLDRSLLLYDVANVRLVFRRQVNSHALPSHVFDFVVAHGNVGGRTYGYKANRISQLKQWFIGDVYLLAHSHIKLAQTSNMIYFDYRGNQKKKKIVEAYTGCFLRGYERGKTSYVERWLYPPTDIGVVKIMLQPESGDKHVSV